MKAVSRSLWLAALVVGWLLIVVAPYYFLHRPFDAANLLGVANTLGDIDVALLLLFLAATVGKRALRAFAFESALEALVIQTGVGYALLALVVFGLGMVGLIQPPLFWILAVGALGLLHRDARQVARSVRALELPRATRGERALALYIALTLGIALLFALTPPTGWDGLQYHLVLPKLALEQGRLAPPPDNISLNFPALVETLFLAAMDLKSDAAAQVVHWTYLALTVGATLAFAERYFTRRIGWLAAAFLVAVPSILLVSTYAYNDAALMLYTITALFWTLRAVETQRARDFILAGILAGCTLGEKYTALFIPLALGALVLFQRRLPTRRAFVQALSLGVAALLLAMPWFLRNYFFVGNPIYPFVFGGLYWDAWRTAWYSRFGTGLLQRPLELALVPYTATVQGFQNGYFDATIGALLLAFLPFNLLKRDAARDTFALRAMWFLVAVLFGFWLLGVAQSKLLWQTRLLFPAFPLLALLAAEGWSRLGQIRLPNFSPARFAALLLAFAFGMNLISNVLATAANRPYDVLLGLETRAQFLTRQLGAYYAMTQRLNAELPQDARVVMLWETRAYYIARPVQPDAILDRLAHLQFLYDGDADAIADEWRREGYTHVLIYREGLNAMLQSGYDPVGAAEMQTLAALEQNHLRLVDGAHLEWVIENGGSVLRDAEKNPYALYEIIK